MGNTQKLSLYTTGEAFGDLVYGLVESGKFEAVVRHLRGMGFADTHIKDVFVGAMYFVGDTRENNDFTAIQKEQDLSYLIHGIKQHTSDMGVVFVDFDTVHNLDMDSLCDIIPMDVLKNTLWKQIVTEDGYEVCELGETPTRNSGVVLQDGVFVGCGYAGHNGLFDILDSLDVCENTAYFNDDEKVLRISSNEYTGNLIYALKYTHLMKKGVDLTPEQLKFVFDNRNTFKTTYGSRETVANLLLKRHNFDVNFGGKYGNLTFLRDYYGVKIPFITKEHTPLDFKYCLRTSPKKSMAGVLDSYFDVDENTIDKMLSDWEKHKDFIDGNELHIFAQEYVEGVNGVAHYNNKGFRYRTSTNRGDVVNGVVSKNVDIPKVDTNKLENLCEQLYVEFDKLVQIEFVYDGTQIIVVQCRLYDDVGGFELTKNTNDIMYGKSFTGGHGRVNKSEVLIVKNECLNPEKLKDKKLLIVVDDVEFAHILALSKSLGIPSMYALGGSVDDIPNEFGFNTEYNESRIRK